LAANDAGKEYPQKRSIREICLISGKNRKDSRAVAVKMAFILYTLRSGEKSIHVFYGSALERDGR